MSESQIKEAAMLKGFSKKQIESATENEKTLTKKEELDINQVSSNSKMTEIDINSK